MRYADNDNSTNGFYIGESIGTRLLDVLAPEDDGLDFLRGIERVGTLLGDTVDSNFPVEYEEPVEEPVEEGD